MKAATIKTIEVTVSPKGETTIQTKGFTGDECRQASRALEAALGLRASERLTSEFYARAAENETLREGP